MRLAAKKDTPQQTGKTAEKKKLGFPVPIRVWLKQDKYYGIVKDAFESESAKKFFDTALLEKLLTMLAQKGEDRTFAYIRRLKKY